MDASPDLSVQEQEPDSQTPCRPAWTAPPGALRVPFWMHSSLHSMCAVCGECVCVEGEGELESLSYISSLSTSPGGGNRGCQAHISCLSPQEADWKSGLGGRR